MPACRAFYFAGQKPLASSVKPDSRRQQILPASRQKRPARKHILLSSYLRRLELDGCKIPRPIVPSTDFAGTQLNRLIFSFYGEAWTIEAPIDWEHNPGTAHWGHDLNRFGFLNFEEVLSSEKEIRAGLALMLDWISKHNRKRFKFSPYAWRNMINIAIRTENWVRFLQFVDKTYPDLLPEDSRARIAESIFRQTMMVIRWVRKRSRADNWTLISLRSIHVVLLSWPEFPHSGRLLAICESYLIRTVELQVLPDGVQHELSSHYHWAFLELTLSITTLRREAGVPVAPLLLDKIRAMSAYLQDLICPDGSVVALGDADADYGPRISEFLQQQTSATGHSEFQKGHHSTKSRLYPYAGIAILRNRESNSLLVFDSGPFGMVHQHEDALSLWYCAFGVNLLIDPGRYLYEQGEDKPIAYLRSSRAHSTIGINGHGQNARANPDEWKRSEPGPPYLDIENGVYRLKGFFDQGYGPDNLPVRHERSITTRADFSTLVVKDHLIKDGGGHYLVEQRWQAAPGAFNLEPGRFCLKRQGVLMEIHFDQHSWEQWDVVIGEKDPWDGWVSTGLNKIEPTPVLVLRGHFDLAATITTRITASRLTGLEST